ncbi:GTPase ObgE [Rickettsia endosymbiont of Halotydeus destructor]|uniref:GTPase ObgE n=1 Tax=Rickettsia endosymbiont of Halotydeus destructor TaxID=2996754 RepID=UPI003BAF5374
MNFIDEAKIYIKGGNGGNGCVSFHREKFIDRGGPDGGDGGRGGSVIFRSNYHLNTLVNFRYKQHFLATGGENGKGSNKSGKSGKSLILDVPIGTQIFSENGDILLYDFTKDEQSFEIIKGGNGGLGNSHFKTSVNQAPRRRTEGEIAEEMWVSLSLKLLSDVGLVGLPNAGKSTFLSVASAAKPKIADYPFTTLVPNLGVVYVDEEEFVLADIPGLIEGAHEGHGLGDKFLKHIERCNVLIHLIDGTSANVPADYKTIRTELESYSELLKDKFEIICLNKCDILTEEEISEKVNSLQKITDKEIFPISTYTKTGINKIVKLALRAIKDQRL